MRWTEDDNAKFARQVADLIERAVDDVSDDDPLDDDGLDDSVVTKPLVELIENTLTIYGYPARDLEVSVMLTWLVRVIDEVKPIKRMAEKAGNPVEFLAEMIADMVGAAINHPPQPCRRETS
jgi:hypothetical protein